MLDWLIIRNCMTHDSLLDAYNICVSLPRSWSDFEIVQRNVAQILWRINVSLMDEVNDSEGHILYINKTIEDGWSKTILDLKIESKLIERS